MNSIIYQSATALAKAIRNKEITSEEIVRSHLDRIREYNDSLNAIVILMEDSAIQRAREADLALARGEIWGPLHGVPITIKEAFDIKGEKTTVNLEALQNNIAEEDALVVSRMKAAGAVILGKTNVPTAVADYQTNGSIYGRTNNPYDLERTPGGSTGGGASAVAAGFTPLEIGSDIGGSLRVPAHFCGIYSLKPTENTVPGKGHIPPMPGARGGVAHMGTYGPLARSVDDLELAFDIIKGPDHRDVTVAPVQFKKTSGRKLSEFNLAWTDAFAEYKANNESCHLVAELVSKISHNGASISMARPQDFDFHLIWETWGYLIGHIQGQDLTPEQRTLQINNLKSRFDGPAIGGMLKGTALDFVQYAKSLKHRSEFIARLQEFFDEFDFWLCPVSMIPAFKHKKSEDGLMVDDREVDYHSACGGFVSVFNATGHPVVVVPLGQSSEGLPIGLQIAGPYWSEPELFHFAKQLSGLIQGFTAPPGYSN